MNPILALSLALVAVLAACVAPIEPGNGTAADGTATPNGSGTGTGTPGPCLAT